MKKTALTFASLLAITGGARAGIIDFYAGVSGSLGDGITYFPSVASFPTSEKNLIKPAKSFGAAAGIDIPLFRFELEYDYLLASKASFNAVIANAYMKPIPIPFVKPYIGFGLGQTFGGTIESDASAVKLDAQSSWAFQGMLGLQVDIPATPLFVDLEWRALYADHIYTFPVVGKEIGYLQSDIRAKIRYVF